MELIKKYYKGLILLLEIAAGIYIMHKAYVEECTTALNNPGSWARCSFPIVSPFCLFFLLCLTYLVLNLKSIKLRITFFVLAIAVAYFLVTLNS